MGVSLVLRAAKRPRTATIRAVGSLKASKLKLKDVKGKLYDIFIYIILLYSA